MKKRQTAQDWGKGDAGAVERVFAYTMKLPAVYRNYKKYKWVKDLTVKEETV